MSCLSTCCRLGCRKELKINVTVTVKTKSVPLKPRGIHLVIEMTLKTQKKTNEMLLFYDLLLILFLQVRGAGLKGSTGRIWAPGPQFALAWFRGKVWLEMRVSGLIEWR